MRSNDLPDTLLPFLGTTSVSNRQRSFLIRLLLHIFPIQGQSNFFQNRFWCSVVIASSINPKSSSNVSGLMRKNVLYSIPSSRRNSCNKVLNTPRSALPRQIVFFLFFSSFFFGNHCYNYNNRCRSNIFQLAVHDKKERKTTGFEIDNW